MGSLLERRRELDVIAASLAAARCGDARPVLLQGAAGIGKSALLAEACTRARAAGMVIVTARGTELERSFPYGIVRQLFERIVLGRRPSDRSRLLSGAAGLAAPVFGLARPAGLLPPANEREATLIGLYWLLVELAETGPLAVAVDDLQWSDRASFEWLLYATQRIAGVRAAVIGTARSGDEADDVDARLVEAFAAHADVVRPEPLTAAAAGVLLEPFAGEGLSSVARLACMRITAGNPLLLCEVGRALAEGRRSGSAISVDDVEHVSSARISRLVHARLRQLSAPGAELARAAAILGAGAELLHAAALAGLTVDEAASAADELRSRGILVRNSLLAFAHPLIERSVYQDVSIGRRGLWHAQAARLLARAGGSDERIAAHLLRSEPVGDSTTVDRLLDAARDAVTRGAPQSAIPVLERALREGVEHRRDEMLATLGQAEAALLLPAAIEHLRAAYALIQDVERRSHVALVLARTLVASRMVEDPTLDRASLADPGIGPDLELRVEATLTAGLRMDPAWAATMSAWTRRRASRPPTGQTDGERSILSCLAGEAALRGEHAETAVRHANAALADDRLLAAETSDSSLFIFCCMALTCAGRYALARRHLQAALEDARARGSQPGFALALTFRADAALQAGDLHDAEADARAALAAMYERREFIAWPLASAWLALALLEQGRHAEQMATIAAEEHGNLSPHAPFAALRYARALEALARRRPAPARDDLLAAGATLMSALCPTPALLPWRSAAARAAARLGDLDAARAEAAEEVNLARGTAAPRAIGVALRALAEVEQAGTRVEHLREAVAVLEASEARLEHGHALCDLGVALRHARGVREAREPLRLALDVAERCGARPLADRARDELLASGARPRRARVFGRDALTPAEMRVASLAAAGATNREIAQSLFVTVKTVESQLAATYRKLGVGSRQDLGTALAAETTSPR